MGVRVGMSDLNRDRDDERFRGYIWIQEGYCLKGEDWVRVIEGFVLDTYFGIKQLSINLRSFYKVEHSAPLLSVQHFNP